ncbi:hypothetical protein [Streptomyces griseorubiginosus]|uniref:hypothetical protein n=1 Tax=Streptomyces griseorubiginosus TaxID=67304 RepID=UPI003696BC49
MGPTTPGWLALPEEEFQERYRPAQNITPGYLHRVLVRALGASVATPPDEEALKHKPLVLDLGSPLPPRLRFYLYQVTQHTSERQQGTYKVQLTSGITDRASGHEIPRQGAKRARLHFDRAGNIRPILMGYHPEWNLFILWDADLHDLGQGFSYSKSVYAPPELVGKALARGIFQTSRRLHAPATLENIIAVRPRRLPEALKLRIRLSNEAMFEGLF